MSRQFAAVRGRKRPLRWEYSHRGEGIDDANAIEGDRGIVRSQPPGRYDVDEIRPEPFPSGHTSRQSDRLIRRLDGGIEDEPRRGQSDEGKSELPD
jgi:hypothetical protein